MDAGLSRKWGPEHLIPFHWMRDRMKKRQGLQAGRHPGLAGVPCNREERPYSRDPIRHIYACSSAGLSACPPPMPHTFWDTGHHACIVGQDGILRATQRVPRSTGAGRPVYERVGRVTNPPQVKNLPHRLLQVLLEERQNALILVGPTGRFRETVVLHRVDRQLPVLLA